MPYTRDRPVLVEPSEELRSRIPGWGADLDPADRPSVPRLQPATTETGAHWRLPEEQPELWPRERSIEHERLPPVFGTSCPPRGVSGAMRKYAYRRYSEARAAHWLVLLAAERVDAVGSHLRSLASLRPDNPITETGVLVEGGHHPVSSRLGRGRADLTHRPLDPLIVAGPSLLGGVVAYRVLRPQRHG